jgi:hypothetical protein
MTYLNLKINGKVETIDQINQFDFIFYKDYRTELKRLINEYKIASNYYAGLYTSKRCANEWKQ